MGWALLNIRADTVSGPPPVSTSEIVASATTVPAILGTPAVSTDAPKETASLRRASYAKNPSQGDLLGSLTIPALKKSWPIIEGTRTSDLKKGVGHYVKSVLPGDKDNCVLSAHRDTYFASLGDVKKGDRLTVETAAGKFNYEVTRTRIVGKNDRTVIVPTGHGVLTLTTCYPFDYVGSAPKRYIVSADLVP
jgi:sortase A